MLGKLKAYKASHGHCYVPSDWPEDPQLGRWVNWQRGHNRKGKLSKERFEKLTALGFDWELLKNRHRMRRRKVQRAVPESRSHDGS